MKISKYNLAAVLVLTALMAVGCSVLPTPQPPPTFVPPATPTPSSQETAKSSVYVVKRGDIEDVIQIRGRVVAEREEFLSFPLSGWLKEIQIRAGDKVEAGALLAELDAVSLRNQVSSAEYNLEQAKLRLEQGKLQAELDAVDLKNEVSDAEYGLQRAKLQLEQARARPTQEELAVTEADLRKAELALQKAQADYDEISSQLAAEASQEAMALQKATLDYEQAQAAYNVKKAQVTEVHELGIAELEAVVQHWQDVLDRTRARLDESQLQIAMLEATVQYQQGMLDSIRARLNDSQLYAPFSGVILSLEAIAGDEVHPFRAIAAIADPSELWVQANVQESDISRVALQQAARITLDAHPESQFMGRLTAVASTPTVWKGEDVYEVTIVFDEGQEVPSTIRMGADVALITQARQNVLLVPNTAIYTEGERTYVMVIEGEEKKQVEVKTGASTNTETEIVRGLEEGDEVFLP